MLAELLRSTECSKKHKPKRVRVTKEIAQIADDIGKAESSLKEFVTQAWNVVEPKTPFIDGYHLDAICEHLEAVTLRQIQMLLINVPPRHMKSLLASVFWPAWVWIKEPHHKWLTTTYTQPLSTRDSRRCRSVIQSQWYQERWGDSFFLVDDQNQKMRFENDKTGYRIATSVDGAATGEGGDTVLGDDLHNVKQAESDAQRNEVLKYWDEVLPTRINNPKTGAFVVQGQRCHSKDISGHILGKGYPNTVHLCLPARYEVNRIPNIKKTVIGFKDKRTKEGEPLWPGMYGDEELLSLEKKLGVYGSAGQLQQRPSPREGGMFNKADFILTEKTGMIIRSVRYWDKAGSAPKKDGRKDKSKFTAGVKIDLREDGSFLISDVVRGRWEAPEREKRMKQTAQIDGKKVKVYIEQEGGSGGKESAQSTVKNLAGFPIYKDHPTGSKETRAEPFSAQVEGGNVYVLCNEYTKKWVDVYLDELDLFPMGEFSDQVDGSSGAFNKINSPRVAGVMGAR